MKALYMSFLNMIRRWKPRNIHYYTPQYILDRIRLLLYELRYPDHPWLTKQANLIISTLLKPTDVGFEWGSGRSTLWFAQRVNHLISVEHNEAWYKAVSSKLKAANVFNVKYILCKLDAGNKKPNEILPYVKAIHKCDKNSLDFVLVDGIYRELCSNLALEKIRPGGIIILDNANRYIPCDSISPGSRPKNSAPKSKEWVHFLNRVEKWRQIWTSNGIYDTAIWFKPSGEYNEKSNNNS